MHRFINAIAIAVVFILPGIFSTTNSQTISHSETTIVAQAQREIVGTSKLTLTMEQRYTIKEIIKGLKTDNAGSTVSIEIGKVVPKTIHLQPMPNEIATKISPVKSHLFFVKGDKVVIVNPKDNRVVEVID